MKEEAWKRRILPGGTWDPGIREVRIRNGRPVIFLTDRGERFSDGTMLTENRKNAVIPDDTMIPELLELFSGHSLYAYEDEIRQGFLTVEGGHRVGICGRAVMDQKEIRTIRDISSLSIRIAREKKGCAGRLIPCLYRDGRVLDTLIIAPPGAGKTTMLRDLVRLVSDGNSFGKGMQVSVIDERGELSFSCRGRSLCDLGARTDVMLSCPKAEGMMMVLRSMAPEVVAVDEIGGDRDLEALRRMADCGASLLATVHGTSLCDLARRPQFSSLTENRLFQRYVILSGTPAPGTIRGIFGEDGERIDI